MKTLSWRHIGVLGLAVAVGACAGTPGDIEPGTEPPNDTAEAGFWMISEKMERRLKTSGRLVDDPRLQQYVNEIACEVAPDYCGDIRVYVVRRPDFNATMMANGAMSVWSGLLLRATSEAQLATVIGHEIAHFQRRHTMQRWRDARAATNVALAFQVASAMAGVSGAGNLAGLMAQAHMAAFSRDNEREADRLGFKMMADAGYAPEAAARVWKGMMAELDAADEDDRPIFFASHPPREERFRTLREMAEQRDPADHSGNTLESRYLDHVLAHRGEWLDDELDRRRWDRAQVLLDRLASQAARLGEIAFYQGELHRRRGADGDAKKALAAYRKALKHMGAPAATHRSLGLVLWSEGERAPAQAAFESYLAKAGDDAPDRAMIQSYINQLRAGS